MLHAEILGNQERSTGVNENPSIYESVFHGHRTSVTRPSYGKGNQIGLNVGGEAMNQFIQNTELDKLHKTGEGKVAIPVKLQMGENHMNDPTMSKYSNPSFLSTKSEKKKGPKTINIPKMPMITPGMRATSKKDVKMLKKKLNAAKTKKQKLKACKIFYIFKENLKKILKKI